MITCTALADTKAPNNPKFSFHLDMGISSPQISQNSMSALLPASMASTGVAEIGMKYLLFSNWRVGILVQRFPFIMRSLTEAARTGTCSFDRKVNITSFMTNLSYDLWSPTPVLVPYVELGIGLSRIASNGYTMFALDLERQVGTIMQIHLRDVYYNPTICFTAGVNFKVTKATLIGIKYNYAQLGTVKARLRYENRYKREGKWRAHELLASAIFSL